MEPRRPGDRRIEYHGNRVDVRLQPPAAARNFTVNLENAPRLQFHGGAHPGPQSDDVALACASGRQLVRE